ncbi:hypothetical protein K503DRAFT_739665 [Rhizopogon vinicolor AM-OR11-026]|uniref:RING-type domain-containing protein n=1 Tax=Rhizopogon vinicolor AM-OR11-026 TaxID=1314800 RepID=A0A1B7N385_9AGAM|nr:hypothetical protein K503DRAFT_739665 [Rhizopogon vinicolor AM-OR11-026]
MLTLSPGSVCDVCAEEYGSHCVPHSIPCGHVLCSSCCHKIIEKTLPRFQPACPFCRDHFTSDDVRLIRIEFSPSGWATPRRRGGLTEGLDTLDRSPSRIGERFPFVEPGFARTRAEARRLEDKVAKVAAKKCSVEEVSTLHKELQDWLTHDEKPTEQLSSLALSAALLRAILMNHFAHSEATKMAKGVEATLKGKLDDIELTVSKQEAELKQCQALYTQKVQECQALRVELSRYTLKSAPSTPSPSRPSTAAPTGLSERRQSVSSSAASAYNVPPMPSMLSRFASTHSRSASVAGGSRPSTPARTGAPSIRSERSETPMQAPPMSSRLRSTSPIPPSRPRTISVTATSPQKIIRSHSDEQERERERIHERWMPSPNVAYSPPTGKTVNYPPYFGSSPAPGRARASFSTNAA